MIDRKVGGAKNVLIKKNDNFVLLFFYNCIDLKLFENP
jgi:hypothetical protein